MRRFTEFGEKLGEIATQFRDKPGPPFDLDEDDIKLFTILDSLCTSFTAHKGDPKLVYVNVVGLGKRFFQTFNEVVN